jgi:hypothetical protein
MRDRVQRLEARLNALEVQNRELEDRIRDLERGRVNEAHDAAALLAELKKRNR